MRYETLGRSGLRVSELCLGTMTFGESWGWGASKAESRKIFDAFAAAGGNFIDTANSYTGGESESFVGEFVQGERDRFVVATKYSHALRPGDLNSGGNHRKSMIQSIESSLRRLQTDYVDLLWLHAWDFTTPVDEVMRALDDLVRAGKVLYVGISDTPAWVAAQANVLAELRGWTPFAGLQIEYSLLQRTPERDLLPMAASLGLGVTAWGPLGAGLLTGKYGGDGSGHGRIEEAPELYGGLLNERNLAVARLTGDVAHEVGASPAGVALAWLRQQSTAVIPIVGTRDAAQLEENLGCLDLRLDDEQMTRLDEASRIDLGFPHDFLASGPVRYMLFAGQHESLIHS